MSQCSIDTCDRPVLCRGWCNKHYCSWRAHGDPLTSRTNRRGSLGERLASALVERPSGCIVWTAAAIKDGYGMMLWQGRVQLTHRLAWTEANGPIPDGLDVLHRCDNPPCCNPAHLFLGTDADNAIDKQRKGRAANKLTASRVQAIRAEVAAGATQTAVAKRYLISRSVVCEVISGKSWSHVKAA